MERKDADYSLQKLKNTKHLTVDVYLHIAKLFEYVLYKMEESDVPPSVYGSYVEKPNYNDYDSEETEQSEKTQELEEVEISESYVDDRNIPLVLATNALYTPFHEDPVKHEEEGEDKPNAEVFKKENEEKYEENTEVSGREPRNNRDSEDDRGDNKHDIIETVKITTKPPKRLKISGEENKTSLHKDGLKRVKESLRSTKKRKVVYIL